MLAWLMSSILRFYKIADNIPTSKDIYEVARGYESILNY